MPPLTADPSLLSEVKGCEAVTGILALHPNVAPPLRIPTARAMRQGLWRGVQEGSICSVQSPWLSIACASVLALVATPASAAAKTKTAKEHSLVGTLQKVDGQTLTVKTSTGAAESVTLTSKAHITKDGKAIQASQLSSDTGAHVKVRYTESNGQKQARRGDRVPADHQQSQRNRNGRGPRTLTSTRPRGGASLRGTLRLFSIKCADGCRCCLRSRRCRLHDAGRACRRGTVARRRKRRAGRRFSTR